MLPAVIQRPVSVRPGGSVIINSEILNASQLEGNSPRFFIISRPKYGKLIVSRETALLRSRRAAVDNHFPQLDNETMDDSSTSREEIDELSFFTYRDVKKGWLRYENTLMETHGRLMDRFEYELQASQLQPARGIFKIEIRLSAAEDGKPIDSDDSEGKEKIKPTSTYEKPTKTVSWLPSMTTAMAIPIFILIFLVLLACVFVFFRRTRIARERERRYVKEKQQQLLAAKPQQELAQPTPDLLGTTVYATVGQRTASMRHSSPVNHYHHNHEESPIPPSSRASQIRSHADYGSVMHVSMMEEAALKSPPARPNLITFDPNRSVELMSTSVPTCKVTPLSTKYGGPSGIGASASGSSGGTTEEYWKGAYHYSSSASDTDLKTVDRLSLDHATGQKPTHKKPLSSPSIARGGSLKPPTKLKENQYWV